MTEDEAFGKWCPFSRVVNMDSDSGMPLGSVGNRQHFDTDIVDTGHPNNCVASDCMAWRVLPLRRKDGDIEGYCGLAGTP